MTPQLVPEVLQQPSIRNPVAVRLGAIAGALSRYYVSLWFLQRFGSAFPYGTLVINITDCFVMGFFFMATERILTISAEIKLLIATGFLGYTMFSTYGLDTFTLCAQRFIPALIYWLGSTMRKIASIQLGVIIARLLK